MTGAATMILGDARSVPIADNTVDVVVTSPPYNVGIDYDTHDDVLPLEAYRDLAHGSMRECYRILKPGGRIWVNIVHATNGEGDHGRATGTRLHLAGIWHEALEAAGLAYRDTVVWNKRVANQATAWGSYRSPAAPNLRGRYEPLLVYFKHHWHRGTRDEVRSPDLTPDEWVHLTKNIWDDIEADPEDTPNTWDIIPDGRNRWHPAPYPRELARRAIILSTWPGDLVVDPFAGAGTTLTTAAELNRNAIGIELSTAYCQRWADTGLQQTLAI